MESPGCKPRHRQRHACSTTNFLAAARSMPCHQRDASQCSTPHMQGHGGRPNQALATSRLQKARTTPTAAATALPAGPPGAQASTRAIRPARLLTPLGSLMPTDHLTWHPWILSSASPCATTAQLMSEALAMPIHDALHPSLIASDLAQDLAQGQVSHNQYTQPQSLLSNVTHQGQQNTAWALEAGLVAKAPWQPEETLLGGPGHARPTITTSCRAQLRTAGTAAGPH